MSNLSKGGTKKDTKMRIRAFPVSCSRRRGSEEGGRGDARAGDLIGLCRSRGLFRSKQWRMEFPVTNSLVIWEGVSLHWLVSQCL
uniref:Uncharacterized protein n=1 Tax=Anguilla anguilla TaxID=7936 RepID=A0A0E9SKG0_ANGAN